MRRTLGTGLLIAALSVGLGGCLRPLYGQPEYGGLAIQRGLQGVRIEIEGERLAHYLRNELEFGLRGGDPSTGPLTHRLVITTRQTVASAIVDRITGAAESATLTLDATYTLYPIGPGPAVTSGNAKVVVSYDRSAQRFASIRSARDAEIQSARQMAEQIKTRIAAYLATPR
jgi:LPS-assembly lipoprotein